MVVALALVTDVGAAPYTVAVLGAASSPLHLENVRDTIMCATKGLGPALPGARDAYEIARVDTFDAGAATPDLDELVAYDVILVYNEGAFADPIAMGDLVAGFVENGRGAVVAGNTFAAGNGLLGRFETQGMSPFEAPGASVSPGGNLGIDPVGDHGWESGPSNGHVSTWAFHVFDGGTASAHVQDLVLVPQAEEIAQWLSTPRVPALVVLEPGVAGQGRVAALNLFPPNDQVDPTSWRAGTDGGRLIAGALHWVAGWTREVTCENVDIYQDLNCNGIDVFDEDTIDNSSPDCQATVDPVSGLPYDNNDYYWDYYRFECEWPTDGYDPDFDKLGFGTIQVFPPGGPIPFETATLQCDNCENTYNPEQYDWDCEGPYQGAPDFVGDACDDCPYVDAQQQDSDGDCFGDFCDNCILVANSDQYDDDLDGVGTPCDNCPEVSNPLDPLTGLQPDLDADTVGDPCDNCLEVFNDTQDDTDDDTLGDACDNCPLDPNPSQVDDDGDLLGNVCDNCPGVTSSDATDRDSDGLGDACDNCQTVANSDQGDGDLDTWGDACDNCRFFGNKDQIDDDQDGVGNVCDICPGAFDPEQSDGDGDGIGDACDNCAFRSNEDQGNRDEDAWGDSCDLCLTTFNEENVDFDGDGLGDDCDNCPEVLNADQEDADGDDLGDKCDTRALRGGGELKPPGQGCSTAGGGPEVGLLLLTGLVSLLRARGAAPRSA